MHDRPIERTENFLRQLAAETPAGNRLITVRECMKLNEVSKVVVDRAVAKLHGEKVLEVRPRSGLYKPAAEKARKRIIDILHYSSTAALYGEQQSAMNFHGELLLELNLVMSRLGWCPVIHMMSCEADQEKVINELIADRVDTAVMFCLDYEHFQHLQRLESLGVNIYNVLPNMVESLPRTLRLDDADIVRRQGEHLVGLGRRRIAYLHSGGPGGYNRAHQSRLDAFCRLALELRLEVSPAWIGGTSWQEEDIIGCVETMLRDGGMFEGIIINDGHVKGVYTALRQHGMEPGRDVAVIGCDDMPWAKYMDPELSTVRVSRHSIAEKICEMISTESVASSVVSNILVERASTTGTVNIAENIR